MAMKVVRQARLELSGGSTPDLLRPPPFQYIAARSCPPRPRSARARGGCRGCCSMERRRVRAGQVLLRHHVEGLRRSLAFAPPPPPAAGGVHPNPGPARLPTAAAGRIPPHAAALKRCPHASLVQGRRTFE